MGTLSKGALWGDFAEAARSPDCPARLYDDLAAEIVHHKPSAAYEKGGQKHVAQ